MRKYNVENYVRYKTDIANVLTKDLYESEDFKSMSRDQLIIKFLPLVENIAKKFSTAQPASGVLDILDLIQFGNIGLINAVDKIVHEKLDESKDKNNTLKSFLSKRIKGNIRRSIDINKGGLRIPEHKLAEMRNQTADRNAVSKFFDSLFLSIEEISDNNDQVFDIPDKQPEYNEEMFNVYLKSLLQRYLNRKEYEVLRLSYGLDCPKHSAKEIAQTLQIKGQSAYVRVSQLKKQAVERLKQSVKHSEILDYIP